MSGEQMLLPGAGRVGQYKDAPVLWLQTSARSDEGNPSGRPYNGDAHGLQRHKLTECAAGPKMPARAGIVFGARWGGEGGFHG